MDVNSREPSQNIIPFRIKGVEIARFDSSGNLKIGTTTTLAPTVRLDISGGEARVNSGSVASTALTTTGRIGVNVASPTVSLDVSGAIQITASSVVATALTTRGRIGINTTSPPTSDLDVNGTVIMRSTLLLNNSLTLPTVFWHKSSDNIERLQYLTNGNTIFKSGSGFLWYDSNNAARMFLSNSGLLGIGTTLPTVALDVSGEGNILTGLTIGSSSNSSVVPNSISSKLAIYHATDARIWLRGNSDGLIFGNNSSRSFIEHRPTSGEFLLGCFGNVPTKFKTANTVRMTILGDGKVGIGTETPTVALDVVGAANVSNYLSVGSGGSGSGATTSTLPNGFYVRTGGSNWRDYIPLLVADTTTNLQKWGGPDLQWYDVNYGASNEIAKQYSYFAGYWLNANRAVQGTSFSVESYASNDTNPPAPTSRGTFTFRATEVSNGVVTAYEGRLSAYNGSFYGLSPQQDGINAGVARRSLSNRTLLMGGSVETGYLGVSGIARVTGNLDVTGSSVTSTALTTTGWIGVNTAAPTVDLDVNGLAKIGNLIIGADPLYAFTAHTFTNAGATGRTGPTLSTVRTTYANAGATWANSYLNMTSDNGIQLWTVPVTGTYTIRAVGAGGGGAGATAFGRGIDIQLTTTLIKGEVIRILVGQQGTYSDPYFINPAFYTGAGGGGTFVVRDIQTPIIVAGGGGGTGYVNNNFVNNNANLGTSGNNSDQAIGGTNGQGGVGSSDGGGGGMFGNGSGNGSEGGLSFINGGLGGIGDPASSINGGFGGGGGGNSADGGGGGGGYSGGGGGGGDVGSRGGGGGGSFGITALTNFGATNTGHGSVTITLLSPSSDFHVSGVSRMAASSATATALTTVGRIGIGTDAPTCPLHVATVGANQNVYALGNVAFINNGTGIGIVSSTYNSPVSIISAGTLWVQGQHVWISSDNRIKKNIVQLNSDRMMNIIRKIRPVSFNFINPAKNGSQTMFGFIAQDVKEHLPESIHYNSDVIPNNLMRGQIDNTSTIKVPAFTLKPDDGDISLNYVLLTTDSSLNFDTQNKYSSTNIYKFKIACWHEWSNEQDIFIHSEYRETNNKYTYVIGVKQDAYDILLKEPCIFVYGQYVYDLHILEYDTVWTVATAALQEVDRQQQADKARIAELEATVASQQTLINDILERLNKSGL